MWLGWRDRPQLDALLAAQQDPSSDGVSPLVVAAAVPRPVRAGLELGCERVRLAAGAGLRTGVRAPKPPVRHGQRDGGPGRARVPGERIAVRRERADGARPRRQPQDPGRPGRERDGDHGPRQRLLAGAAVRETPAPPPPTGTSVGPCSHYWGERTSRAFPNPYAPGTPLPWLICGYTPQQIASAYGIDQLHKQHLDGRGQTIAITGAFFSPTIRADLNRFSRTFGLPHARYSELVAPGLHPLPA